MALSERVQRSLMRSATPPAAATLFAFRSSTNMSSSVSGLATAGAFGAIDVCAGATPGEAVKQAVKAMVNRNDNGRMNDMCVVQRPRSIVIWQKWLRQGQPNASALTCLVARGGLVDDVHAALATDETVVTMARLQGFERVLDLHLTNRSVPGPSRATKSAPFRARGKSERAIDEGLCECQPVRPGNREKISR